MGEAQECYGPAEGNGRGTGELLEKLVACILNIHFNYIEINICAIFEKHLIFYTFRST